MRCAYPNFLDGHVVKGPGAEILLYRSLSDIVIWKMGSRGYQVRKYIQRVMALGAMSGLLLSVGMLPAVAQAAKWTCSAENLKSGSYRGGKTATIHLHPYKNGAAYPVTKVSETEVVGVTKDGTPFTCVRS